MNTAYDISAYQRQRFITCGLLWDKSINRSVMCVPLLHRNKTVLVQSNDKADTTVPDAIIKSGLIHQTGPRQRSDGGGGGDDRRGWWWEAGGGGGGSELLGVQEGRGVESGSNGGALLPLTSGDPLGGGPALSQPITPDKWLSTHSLFIYQRRLMRLCEGETSTERPTDQPCTLPSHHRS